MRKDIVNYKGDTLFVYLVLPVLAWKEHINFHYKKHFGHIFLGSHSGQPLSNWASIRPCIVVVIYRHPSMDFTDFNCNYLNNLLEIISNEQISIFLLGDSIVNLLNYNEHNQTNEFLDPLAPNSLILLILQPNRITSHSNTLIDDIFFKYYWSRHNIR